MIIILLKEYRIKMAKEMIVKFISKRKQNALAKWIAKRVLLRSSLFVYTDSEEFCERKGNVRWKN